MEIIHSNLVISELNAIDKWECVEEMVDHLIVAHEIRIIDRSIVLDALFEREKSVSTGMSDGVAIPHAATDAVEDVIGVIGVSRSGIPFESLDGENTRIICLLVYPLDTFREHVKTLATIANIMSDPIFRQDFIEAESAQKMIKIIEEKEGKAILSLKYF